MTVNGVLGCAEGMCVSSQMYACTHFRSSWEVRGIRVLHSLGPPRSACSIVYGRVDMWASQFFLYAFKSELKSGCMWSAALRLSVGVFLWGELIFSVVITHLPTASCLTRALTAGDPSANGLSDTENTDKRRAREEDETRNILDNSPPLRTLTSSLLLSASLFFCFLCFWKGRSGNCKLLLGFWRSLTETAQSCLKCHAVIVFPKLQSYR